MFLIASQEKQRGPAVGRPECAASPFSWGTEASVSAEGAASAPATPQRAQKWQTAGQVAKATLWTGRFFHLELVGAEA